MAQFTQAEVNSIREVAMCHQSVSRKLHDYAGKCNDQHLKQMFQKAGTDASSAAQKLIQMLG